MQGPKLHRRVYRWCDEKDTVKSFMWGCSLQYELDIVIEEFGLEEIDLLSSFNTDDLTVFRKRAEAAEKQIVSIIEERGILIDAYNSIDEFLDKN